MSLRAHFNLFLTYVRSIGCAPFSYDRQKNCLILSNEALLFSIALIIFEAFISPWSIYVTLETVEILQNLILYRYLAMHYIYEYFLSLISVLFQLLSRRALMETFNEGFDINRTLTKMHLHDSTKTFRLFCVFAVKIVALQTCTIVGVAFIIRSYMQHFEMMYFIRNCAAVFHSALTIGGITNLFYGANLFSVYYFSCLNRRIRLIVKRINRLKEEDVGSFERMKRFCDFSDAVDELAILHRRICQFTLNVNKLFSKQMVLIFINLFLNISGQVRVRVNMLYDELSVR